MDKEWQYGDTMCKLFKFSQTFGLTCSTYLVVAIALDRLWAIVTPLNRSVSSRFQFAEWAIALKPKIINFTRYANLLKSTHMKSFLQLISTCEI